MSIERAVQINSLMNQHTLFREGIIDTPPASLNEYSLRELLDAADMVRELNAAPSVDGKKQVHLTSDPRLIAALYVAYHYPAESPDDCSAVAAAGDALVFVFGRRFLQPR